MNAHAQAAVPSLPALGIIAGSGELPRVLIQACLDTGRPYFVLALEETAEEATATLAGTHYAVIRFGAIGKAFDILRKHQVRELVMAGRVTRPRIASIRPDLKGAKLLARIGTQLLSGDNELLSNIVTFLEEEGFRVAGAEDVVRDLLTPEGMIGSIYPDKRAQSDIETGARMARAVGALDIGQAVMVHNGIILGVEAAEGTDGLISRCALLRPEEKGGVLVKVKKPQQERRVDLPTIGVETVERLAECGFAGVAVEAGASLILNRREVARRADALGVFVIGFSILE
ncbi:MAG: UDP-2,3-diacylglucosamine diphosphatase LpxI [Alphaproteobacteria bacterium]|nr:UDP-2,3-diacylglucosamine diphosphatase LpxI [Alphaproteobacteria bacterium]